MGSCCFKAVGLWLVLALNRLHAISRKIHPVTHMCAREKTTCDKALYATNGACGKILRTMAQARKFEEDDCTFIVEHGVV